MADTRDDEEQGFETAPEEERELLEAITEVERGETVCAEDLLERLRSKPLTGTPAEA